MHDHNYISGGLLIALPPSSEPGFKEDFKRLVGRECWSIGTVEKIEDVPPKSKANPPSVVFASPKVVEVDFDSVFEAAEGQPIYTAGFIQGTDRQANDSPS